MKLTKDAARMEQYIDRFAFDSYLTLAVVDETFAPLLRIGMHITIKLSEDMEQTEGLKLLRLGPSVSIARTRRYGDALYINGFPGLRGTFSAKQVEEIPIAVLGDIIDIE